MNFALTSHEQAGPVPWPMPPQENAKGARTSQSGDTTQQSSQVEELPLGNGAAGIRERGESTKSLESHDAAKPISDNADQNDPVSLGWSSNSADSVDVDEFFTSDEIFVASAVDRELDACVPTLRSFNKLFSSDEVEELENKEPSQLDTVYSNPSHQNITHPKSQSESKKSLKPLSSSNLAASQDSKPVLRRPMASRRRRVVDISTGTRTKEPEEPKSSQATSTPEEPPDLGTLESRDARIGAQKGILMRTTTHHRNIAGIRRAETGVIMSKQELQSTRSRNVPDNPIPKSLRPWLLDDTISPDTLFLSPASHKGTPGSRGRAPMSKYSKPSYDMYNEKDEGGLSLSSIRQTTTSRRSSMRTDQDSWRLSEGGPSTGLVGRLSSGIRKATSAFGRKSAADIGKASETDIVIRGTVDEAVCRICAICRNMLGYRVVVKKTGRKIRVESTGSEDDEYLRAVLVIRELEGRCAINIRQSRSDGMKTSIGTLWMFYQRLDRELNRVEEVSSGLFSDGSIMPK